MTARLDLLRLAGDACARAAAQTAAAPAEAVRAGILARLAEARDRIDSAPARAFLAAQRDFCAARCAPELAELDALAQAYAVPADGVFALFHLSALSHAFSHEGCSAFAVAAERGGALLGKNRDLSGPHPHFQQVFLQSDPAFACGAILHVGSLGMPGVYSSGINARGLALADTAIPAPMHVVGWPRYFLMTRLLATCADVEAALAFIAAERHNGGGSLILADASGASAAVELFADGARIAREAPAFRTNHFRAEPESATRARQSPAAFASTMGRSATLAAAMRAPPRAAGEALALLLHDGADGREALRRAGRADGATTVSSGVYDTATRSLLFVGEDAAAPACCFSIEEALR